MRPLIFTLSFILSMCSQAFSAEYNIMSYGAVGDGVKLNTRSIQKAIDEAHAQGGGMVRIPAGRFVTGTLLMKSGVELHLEKRAVLLGSIVAADYPALSRWKALIGADGARGIAITGKGINILC